MNEEEGGGICGAAVIVAVLYGGIVGSVFTSLVWWLLT